jgi:SAM-dependent methyltransferase
MDLPDPQSPLTSEQQRIRAVYQAWHRGGALPPYAWHRPEVMAHAAAHSRVAGALLAATVGPELGGLRIVDVGCGSGGFLRQLISWGADPSLLSGTEYQQERLDQASRVTAAGVRWHLGDLDVFADGGVDLVVANTVFSSILDEGARHVLAGEMWRILRPGGWLMLFDFRYNNPRNPQVRKVTRAQLRHYWPARASHYRTVLLAPPLGRALARAPRLLAETLEAVLPPLRSHFVYACRKD